MKYAGFQSVKLAKPQRSAFDMSHLKRSSTRMGRLTPIFLQEAVPSDYWTGSSEILVRLAPLLAPIYDQIELFVHFFFIPNRLLWEDWEEFITGGRLGVGIDPVTAPVPPFVDISDPTGSGFSTDYFPKSSLADYLGVPIFSTLTDVPGNMDEYAGIPIDIMPFLAYQLVWFEYYRDRNYVSDDLFDGIIPSPSGDVSGAGMDQVLGDGTGNPNCRKRCYKHDYFRSALPFTQRGEEVLMPLAGTGSVTYLNVSQIKRADGTLVPGDGLIGHDDISVDGAMSVEKQDATDTSVQGRIENIDEVLLTSSSVSINDFRSAYAL